MTIRTRSPAWAIVIAAIAAAAFISAADGRELRSSAPDTGEPRDLVNRPDCWTETAAGGWGLCTPVSLKRGFERATTRRPDPAGR